ncbi:acetate--CoA ligase [Halorientalis sp. IM1011]|uniref:acetate--CoA ligase n=1 Tax=Halorientalis sp. IM1011 TaxID=1932360 RepID=UPI00097CCF73|nr:acetate--CoA ligase [Halorientalis sp. IM1011]AQL44104.1 acetate--CoA ligase [Halorientalis sp. IM1011]
MPSEDPAEQSTRASVDEAVDPPRSFVEQANVSDPGIYDEFADEWPDCWARAADLLSWSEPYDEVLGGAGPPFRWFDGGELNASYNCLDRHVENGRKNQVALTWEGRLGESRTYSYLELYREVNEFAAALRELGVEEDDVVTLYLPMIPELPVAMLACARIGAPHSVVFAGFSADALAERMDDADSEYLITCDGYYRRGAPVHQKSKADNAAIDLERDVTTVVVDRLGDGTPLTDGERDYEQLIATHRGETVEPVARDATDQLFLIYTSGTTGEPTGVRHTTGGYLSHVAWTSRAVLDIKPEDTYWCSADIGWITGHSYTVYGPLALGTTTMLYEGTPDHPEKDRVWELIERNAVDVFYTAPTAIRAFMKWGEKHPERHDLSSLRLLGTVGEPLNSRAWNWYREHIGAGECPVVDTWWQTETGGVMVSTLPGVDRMKPGAAGRPLPGIGAEVVDGEGDPVEPGESGYLVVTDPWPGMPLSMVDDEDWFAARRPSRPVLDDYDWAYFTEDGATVDEDGYVTLLGRVDDVLNVSGHRFGTMEIESAVADVTGVAEAAVVAGPHDLKGEAVYAYVSPAEGEDESELRQQVHEAVEAAISPIAVPDVVVFTPDLPKTRSGKVMRRLLESVAHDEDLGDTSALRNPEVVGELESALDDE